MWVLLCSGGHRESTGGCPPPTWAEELHGMPLPSQSGPQAWYPTPLMGVGWGAQTQSRDRQRAAPEPTPATMGTSGSVGLFMKLGKECFPLTPTSMSYMSLAPQFRTPLLLAHYSPAGTLSVGSGHAGP